MKFIIRFILVIIVLIIVSQLEYKGRKIQTYAEEYIKSYMHKDDAVSKDDDIYQEQTPTEVKKVEPKKIPTNTPPASAKATTVNKKKESSEVGDKDRKQLQDLLEQ